MAFGALAPPALLEIGLRVCDGVRGTYSVADDVRRIRATSAWAPSDDPELLYVSRPGRHWMEGGDSEVHGILRPVDVDDAPAPGALRVAVIGDSVGAGFLVRYEERFVTLLEGRLAQDLGRPVEMLNCCVDGYDTLQEARLLETKVDALAPAAVVVVYCLNDPGVAATPYLWFREPTPPASYALQWMRRALPRGDDRPEGRVYAPADPPKSDVAWKWTEMYDPRGAGWREVSAGFDRIAAWSRARRVPVLVVVAPLLVPEDPRGEQTQTCRRQVIDAACERGLRAIDLQPVCARGRIEDLRLSADDVYHFGVAGHRAVADELLAPLRAFLAAAAH